jgi:hypothetical protein
MYLDYSKLKSGQAEQPILRLRTLAGKELGAIPWAHNLTFEINYTDVSEISFEVPFQTDGQINPLYRQLTSYKVIYTEQLGVYVLGAPTKSGDGVEEKKTVVGYSTEKLFEKKNLYLEEGTYNFWNPAQPDDTILGRIIELDTTWKVGYVDPKLIGCYRTFDEYDNDALSFCYGDAMEKYQCAIVFDVYGKTINAYDASKSRGTLPIYLSYQNLVEEINVEELTDEIVTKLHVYGSDDLTIRDVNPAGTDYLIDLSYFIGNGDLDITIGNATHTLAEKVQSWELAVRNRQPYYTGLVSARASKTAQRLAEEATLTDLNSDLESLQAQQSVVIQSFALETTDTGKAKRQKELDNINDEISTKKSEIADQESKIADLQSEIDRYAEDITAVNEELAMEKYFTAAELKVLNLYLIEGDLTEETFVATEVDTSASGVTSTTSGAIALSGAEIVRLNVNNKTLYTIAGGTLNMTAAQITADITRGTLEIDTSGKNYILTAYLGATIYGEHNFSSGMLTMSGTISQLSSDISAKVENGITEDKGSKISFKAGNSNLFFTVNVSEYQKYSVAQELYDFGVEALDEMAWPVYEFTLDSANFLYQKEFEPFKDELELGKAVYINMLDDGVVQANLIGITLDFENPDEFSLTFSNQYRLKNGAESLADTISKSSASSRSFDASKYLYNQVANKTTQVSQFMEGQLDAAVNTILGASNQSVVINGAGIQVGGDSNYQLRIVDNMIAMTDDAWKTAKLALGLFATEDTGQQWGVNAEMVAGKLIIGNNMVLENATDEGVMQFKVDASGAWLNNSTFVLQKDKAGRMILDPKYGLMAGTELLFDTEGTTVKPSFLDSDEEIVFDSDGMPKNTNFFLDIRDGSAYFRGTICATGGTFSGSLSAATGTFSGALSGATGTFSGSLSAASGTFKGTVQASEYLDSKGNKMMTNEQWDAKYLNLKGLNVNDNFIVDENGNVTITNGSISWSAVTGTTEIDNRISTAQSTANKAQTAAETASTSADTAAQKALAASGLVEKLANGNYPKGTFIDGTSITSPNITGGTITGGTFYGSTFYASDKDAWAQMDGTSFSLYNTGNKNPQAILSAVTNSVKLILGTGSGTDFTAGRFYIEKAYSSTFGNMGGIYLINSSGDILTSPAIIFYNNGNKIAFTGSTVDFSSVKVTGLSSTAVFG